MPCEHCSVCEDCTPCVEEATEEIEDFYGDGPAPLSDGVAPDEETEMPPQPTRRPPYAVAYSVGGHFYEALLPGDASVVAEDGVLKIQHGGAVLAIVRVQPVQTEEGDG